MQCSGAGVMAAHLTAGRSQQHAYQHLTYTPVPGVITATALKVPHAAVPGQGVHNTSGADGMHKGCLSGS